MNLILDPNEQVIVDGLHETARRVLELRAENPLRSLVDACQDSQLTAQEMADAEVELAVAGVRGMTITNAGVRIVWAGDRG